MSQENLDTLRRFGSAWRRRDRAGFLAELHADVKLVTDARWPDGGTYVGHRGVADFFDSYTEAFSSEGGETMALTEAGDKVVTRLLDEVSGKESGVATDNAFSAVYSFEDDLIVRIEFFVEHAEALEAVGLSE